MSRASWVLIGAVLLGALFTSADMHAQGRVVQNDAGTKAVGYLPPSNAGVVRLLLRVLTSADEDGHAASTFPAVRVYSEALQIGCSDPMCVNAGEVVQSEPPTATDTLHLGIVLDDTLRFGRGRSLAAAVCDGLRAAAIGADALSAWRIGAATGASSVAGPTGDLEVFCTELAAGMTGRNADSQSPIYEVVQTAVDALASDTEHGVWRELLVISDGVSESCVDSPDEIVCATTKLEGIVETAVGNAIPISVMLIDSSEPGRRVALYPGSTLRDLGADTHGVVRGARIDTSQEDLVALLHAQFQAIGAVGVVPVECLAEPPQTASTALRVNVVEGSGAAERVVSSAVRVLASAPLVCENQAAICDAARLLCVPNAEIATRARARQTGSDPAPSEPAPSVSPNEADDEREASGDDEGSGPDASDEEVGEPSLDPLLNGSGEAGSAGSPMLSRSSLSILALVGAAVLLGIAGWMWLREDEELEAEARSPWENLTPPRRTPKEAERPGSKPVRPPTRRDEPDSGESGRGEEVSGGGRKASGEDAKPQRLGRADTLVEDDPAATPPLSKSNVALWELRRQTSMAAAVSVGSLGAKGRFVETALPRDEWVRMAVVPGEGLIVVGARDAEVLLRFDSGTRTVVVRPGPRGEVNVNRERLSNSTSVVPGDVVHVGVGRVPIEVREVPGTPPLARVTLAPSGAASLQLPTFSVEQGDVVIGRDPEPCSGWENEFADPVRLPIDTLAESQRRRISNDHLVLWLSGGILYGRDVSSNGTRLNGVPMLRGVATPIPVGAELRLSSEVCFRVTGQS